MKIGLIADSHDHMQNTARAIELFREQQVEVILHAGDMVSPPLIGLFKDCGMLLHGVFGNNDGEKLGLARFFEIVNGELHGDFADLTLADRRIAIYHGTSAELLETIVASGRFDLVVTGHTHVVQSEVHGETLLLNPGSAHGFAIKATVMVYDSEAGSADVISI